MDEKENEKETLKTLIRYIIGDSLKKEKIFWVKNNVKSLPKKKWMTKKRKEKLKTLIRYIIPIVLNKNNFKNLFLGNFWEKLNNSLKNLNKG